METKKTRNGTRDKTRTRRKTTRTIYTAKLRKTLWTLKEKYNFLSNTFRGLKNPKRFDNTSFA